jgi:hypothetical protein
VPQISQRKIRDYESHEQEQCRLKSLVHTPPDRFCVARYWVLGTEYYFPQSQ